MNQSVLAVATRMVDRAPVPPIALPPDDPVRVVADLLEYMGPHPEDFCEEREEALAEIISIGTVCDELAAKIEVLRHFVGRVAGSLGLAQDIGLEPEARFRERIAVALDALVAERKAGRS